METPLGLIESQMLMRAQAMEPISAFTPQDMQIMRPLIKIGLVEVKTPTGKPVYSLTEAGESALEGEALETKLDAVQIDPADLSSRLRAHAEKRKRLQVLEGQKKALLQKLENEHKEIFQGVKCLQKEVANEESGLEPDIIKAAQAGIAFGYGINGIQVEHGTVHDIMDEYRFMQWLIAENHHALPDIDRVTMEPKHNADGSPKMIPILTIKNAHRFVARFRDQITMGQIPAIRIVPQTKISWSKDMPDLWTDGVTLGAPEESEDDPPIEF
jgi:hypothetical protein